MKALMRWVLVALVFSAPSAVAGDPVSFADLARHPQYQQVKLSPDGNYVAVTTVVKDRTVLAVLRVADMKGLRVQSYDYGDITGFWWVSPTRILYTEGIRVSSFEAPVADGQFYAINADGSGGKLLYGPGSHHSYYGPARLVAVLPDDPAHVLVALVNRDKASDDGVKLLVQKMSVTDGSMTDVMAAPAPNVEFVTDHAGNVRFAYGMDDDDQMVLYRHPPGEGDWQPMPEAAARRDVPLAFDASDRMAWFSCNVSVGFGVCRWDPATRRMTTVWTHPRVVATGLAAGPATDRFLGVNFDDGRPGVALFDPKSQDAGLLKGLMQQFPGQSVQFVSSTGDGSRAIVVVWSDTDPGVFYLYDRATRKLTGLSRAAPWIDPKKMASRQPFRIAARDGLELQGYLSYPPGWENVKHLPMVVYVHGGPYGERDWWEYDPGVQAIATRGYLVLQVNFRGSGGYGYEFEKAGWLQWGGKMQDDVTDATRWAIAQDLADPNRICIYGASYGGYAALEGAIREPDLYRCAIGYVGVYDLGMMYTRGDIPQSTNGKHYLKRVLGDDKAALARRSPVNQADRLQASVMLIVGGEDTRAPSRHGTEMRKALRKLGRPVEWLYQRKEGHGFYREANVADLYARIDAFLAANIGPGGVATPAPRSAAEPVR